MLLGAIGPRNVGLAAEVFDQWQPIPFHPDLAGQAFGASLPAGKAKRDPAQFEPGNAGAETDLRDDDPADDRVLLEARQPSTAHSAIALYQRIELYSILRARSPRINARRHRRRRGRTPD